MSQEAFAELGTPASEFSCWLQRLMKRVSRVTQLVKSAASNVEG